MTFFSHLYYISSKKTKVVPIFMWGMSVYHPYPTFLTIKCHLLPCDRMSKMYVNFLSEIKTQPGVLLRPKFQPLCKNELLAPQIY